MLDVAIIGAGQTPVGEHWDSSLRLLAADAIRAATEDAGTESVDALFVGNAFAPTFSSQAQLGALIADYAGLGGIEAVTVESGDASGAAALRIGYLAVASGAVKTALVVGVEKSTDTIGSARIQSRGVSLDADYESTQGATLTALAAMLMRRYMYTYGVDLNAFENFTINAHVNGSSNPYAMFRNLIKSGRFARAPMVADPVSLFDYAPDADGAAAVVLTSLDRAADLVPHPVLIAGSAVSTDTLAFADRKDPLQLTAVRTSFQKALAQANVTHSDLDFIELHDAYTILSTLSFEAMGFAEPGTGWRLASENEISLHGSVPISTFGGLKSRGNPAGATGVYQAVEACLQLRGQADVNQVTGARIGLIQNLGGLASTAITHVLRA